MLDQREIDLGQAADIAKFETMLQRYLAGVTEALRAVL